MQHSAGFGQIFSELAEDLPPSMRRTDIGIFFGPIQGLACLVIGVSLLVHVPFQRQIKLIGYACWALVATAVLQALIDANSQPDFMGRTGSLWMSIGNELVQIVPALLGILVWRKYRVRIVDATEQNEAA